MDPFKFIKDNTYGINQLNIPPEKKVDKLLIFFSSVCAATAAQRSCGACGCSWSGHEYDGL